MGASGEVERTVAQAILSAAERFCHEKNGVSLTQKRLLYEYLAYPGPNGKTLSGLYAEGAAASSKATVDLVYITRRWFGLHIIKHYYVMRQYKDASGVVLNFLKFLRSEGTLPSSFSKALDAAIEVCVCGCCVALVEFSPSDNTHEAAAACAVAQLHQPTALHHRPAHGL